MCRRVLIAAFLTATAFLMAHVINLVVAQALTRSIFLRQAPVKIEHRPTLDVNRLRRMEEILASGVFGRADAAEDAMFVRTKAKSASSKADVALSIAPPIDAAKKVKLVGTVVAEGEASMAVIEDISSKKQTLYRLHDVIADVGRIAQIRNDAIVIRQGTQHEILAQEYAVSAVPTNAQIVATPGSAVVTSPSP